MQRITAVLGLLATLFLNLTGPANAQGWEYQEYRENGMFNFGISVKDGLMSFSCFGRFPGLDPMILEGNNHTTPYNLELNFSQDTLIDGKMVPSGPMARTDIVMVSGGKGFRLPKVIYNELIGEWEVTLAFSDPLILEVLNSGGLEVRAGGRVLATLPTKGLAVGLAQAMVTCDAHWRQFGNRTPANVAPIIEALQGWSGIVLPLVSLSQPVAISTGPGSNGAVMAALIASTDQICESASAIDPTAITQGDFDGDGQVDLVLDWSGVSCLSGPNAGLFGGGYCGASHCSNHVFVSSRVAIGLPPVDFLAQGTALDPANPSDILIGVGLGNCHYLGLEPDCLQRWRWSGTGFVEVLR